MSAAFSCRAVWLFACLLTASALLRAAEPDPNKLIQRTYYVADLLLSEDGTTRMKPAELLNQITNEVAPDTWCTNSGPGTAEYFPLGMTLVISQTPEINNRVDNLLITMRWIQKAAVATEVQIVSIPAEALEQTKRNVAPAPKGYTCDFTPSKFIKGINRDAQPVKVMEPFQQQPRASVLRFPRVTTPQRESISVQVLKNAEKVSGDLKVQASVGLDRTTVEMTVEVARSAEEENGTATQRVRMPLRITSGQTILLEFPKEETARRGGLKQQPLRSLILVTAHVVPPPPPENPKPVVPCNGQVERVNSIQVPHMSGVRE